MTRHSPFAPFDNHDSEIELLKLSGSLPEQVQSLAMYLGIALNLLSAYGYLRSHRNSLTSNVPVLGHLRPVVEIASSLSLAIAPNMLLMMIKQYEYLQTATHLGATEAIMTLIPALLVAPALLKVPSIVEGTGHLINDVVIRPIAGAVRGMKNTERRKERQEELTARQEEEKRNNDLKLRTSRNFYGSLMHRKLERRNMPYPIGLKADVQSAVPVDLDLPPFMTGVKSPPKKILGTEAGLPEFLVHSKT